MSSWRLKLKNSWLWASTLAHCTKRDPVQCVGRPSQLCYNMQQIVANCYWCLIKGDRSFAQSYLTFLKFKAVVLTVIFHNLWKGETIVSVLKLFIGQAFIFCCILSLKRLHDSKLMISKSAQVFQVDLLVTCRYCRFQPLIKQECPYCTNNSNDLHKFCVKLRLWKLVFLKLLSHKLCWLLLHPSSGVNYVLAPGMHCYL